MFCSCVAHVHSSSRESDMLDGCVVCRSSKSERLLWLIGRTSWMRLGFFLHQEGTSAQTFSWQGMTGLLGHLDSGSPRRPQGSCLLQACSTQTLDRTSFTRPEDRFGRRAEFMDEGLRDLSFLCSALCWTFIIPIDSSGTQNQNEQGKNYSSKAFACPCSSSSDKP